MDKQKATSLEGLFTRIIRLHFRRSQILFEPLGIYPGQPPILLILAKREDRTQKELAGILRRTPATVAIMLRRMEKAGFVQRSADEIDRWVMRVGLTEKGRRLVGEIERCFLELGEECFAGFSKVERAAFAKYLERMKINLERGLTHRQGDAT
jgi:MarR family transcriptional regulator, organic hydroperoxide resistance regulator